MAKMTDAELEAFLKEDKSRMMTDEEVLAHLNEQPQAQEESMLSDIAKLTEPYAKLANQGIMGGLSDEFLGGVEAAGQLAGVKGLSGKFKDMSLQKPVVDPSKLKDVYVEARNKEREALKQAEELPLSSTTEFVGGVFSPVNKLGNGLSIAKQAALAGGIAGYGKSESENLSGDIANAALGSTIGAALGKAGEKIAGRFQNKASDLAENAIGATAVQAEKLQPETGKFLLENNIVGYLDNPESIAAKSDVVMKQATRTIDKTLEALDKKGVDVNVDQIVSSLENKAQELSTNPAMADVVSKLNKIIKNIYAAGESKIPVSKAEIIKRGFGDAFPKTSWIKPEKSQAQKMAYLAYRDAVENASQVVDPSLAKEFIGAKKVYGMLKPVRDAAERRALQQNQSPIGGLLDVATAGTAAATGNVGPAGQVVAAAARREMAPRISSTLAKGLYDIGQDLSGRAGYANIVNNPSTIQAISNQVKSTQTSKDVINVLTTMSPYDREQYIKKDSSLTPTERAVLLKQNRNAR